MEVFCYFGDKSGLDTLRVLVTFPPKVCSLTKSYLAASITPAAETSSVRFNTTANSRIIYEALM